MKELKFEDLPIRNEIKKAISDMGYESTTPIQAQSIPLALEGNDVIGLSQTGSGKTASFAIPAIQAIDSSKQGIQCLILCPTRELTLQVVEEFRKFTKYLENIKITPIYGGARIDNQIRELKRGTKIVVGTPGRVIDHINRKTLKLENTSMVVLDEADEMLSMGFKEDLETILKSTNETRQTLLFSATMPSEILKLTKTYQKNPLTVKIKQTEKTLPKIDQVYFTVKEKMKLETLIRLLEVHQPKSCVVFCNTKRKVDDILETLKHKNYSVDGIHGDIKQIQRDRIMKSFKQGKLKILIATDVAARGIDVNDLEIVINYDVPDEIESYVHRIGRTGRSGKTGKAFTMVVGKQNRKMRDIQQYTKTKIKEENIPSLEQVSLRKRETLKEEILSVITEHQYVHSEVIDELVSDKVNPSDIAKALLTLKESANTPKVEGLPDLNLLKNAEGMVEIFVNAGKKDNIKAKDILGSISANTGIPGKEIGRINLLDSYSFVEVPMEYVQEVILGMKNKQIKGRDVNLEVASH